MFKNIYISLLSPYKRADIFRKEGIKIGKNCSIYNKVSFGSEPYLIQIGDNVRLTNGVKFITHDGAMWVLRKLGLLDNADLFGQIIIGNNVHIGINAIIMPNVTIGDNVIIGVGAIVTKNIPSNSVAAGIPARVIKTIEEYYEKNKDIVDFTNNMNPKDKKDYLIKKYNL